MQVYRIDDVPLIYAQLEELKLQQIIDQTIPTHGNWQGISLGYLLTVWLCYLISEADHKLSPVESWVSSNLLWLQSLTGQATMSSKDFTDDRLELALDYISDSTNWLNFESEFEGNSLSIYSLKSNTVRLDAAPMQGHHQIKEGGLFQMGFSKHHKKMGQFKVMLAVLDNAVNNFAYPLYHQTFSGEQSDDKLYHPVIERCHQLFKSMNDNESKLVVGDSKMGSKYLRNYIRSLGDYYLVPLSKIQLSEHRRKGLIMNHLSSDFEKVYKKDKEGKLVLVAQGFETTQVVEYRDKESQESISWEERLIFILSPNYAKSQLAAFDKKLAVIEQDIIALSKTKQGKKRIENQTELEEKINLLLKERRLSDYIKYQIKEVVTIKQKQKYGDRPACKEKLVSFEINIAKDKQAIDAKKQTMGWQVYGCLAPQEELSLEQCVWKYRGQNQIEKRFDDLRNKIAPLIPIYLRKDNRIEALVNLLMIALKTISLMEYKAAKNLKERKKQLANIYPGNPKQSTERPTTKRMLTAFKGLSIVVLKQNNGGKPKVEMTPLNDTQKEIIDLIGFKSTIYDKLKKQINISFST